MAFQKIAPFSAALNFVFPPVCAACHGYLKDTSTPVCSACWDGLETDAGPFPDCSTGDFAFSSIRAIWRFSSGFQSIAHLLKYDKKRAVGRRIGELMFSRTLPEYFAGIDLLVPVPVHHTRKRERGYNQAEVVAQAIAERSGIALHAHALKRLRKTGTQTKLGKTQRGKNIFGAFMAVEDLSGKKVLLVDDVFTTGATVNACAQALKAAGAAEIRVLTAARA